MQQHIGKAISTVHNRLEAQKPKSTDPSSEGVIKPWDSIELTPQQIEIVLGQARYDIWEAQQAAQKLERSKEIEQWIKAPWDANDLMQHIKWRAKEVLKLKWKDAEGTRCFGLKVTDENRKVLTLLAFYFTRDEANFLAYGKQHFVDPEDKSLDYGNDFDINKGICLYGNIGPGKTTLMKLFQQNKRQCFSLVSCRTIVDNFITNGVSVIDQFSRKKPEAFMDPNVFYQKFTGWAFDDLGTEMTLSANYANRKPVMEEIFQNLYDQYSTGQMNRDALHMTTNLSPGKISETYGPRVSSRFNEMFNIVVFNGPDMREII